MASVTIPFCGQTYMDRSSNANDQRSINLYPFHSPTTEEPNRIIMYPTPGYLSFLTFNNPGDGAVRGGVVIRLINDILYVISGINFYRIATDGTKTFLGTLNTSSGKCFVVTNTVDITISDGSYGYVYNLSSTVFSVISTSGGFPVNGVSSITYQDGYYLALKNGTRTVIQSALLDGTTWPALAFDTVTSFPDNGIAVYSDQNQLYIFGPHITEVQQNVGTIPYAFQKVSGVLIQAGCAAVLSIAKVGTTVIWLADDIAGSIYVAALIGYNPQPISTAPINEIFARYTVVSDAFAYTYREGDNQFYVITFPSVNNGLGATWAYDTKLKMWHEKFVLNPSYPTLSNPPSSRDFPDFYASYNGLHIVGNSNKQLAYMSQNYATEIDATTALRRIRTCQHVQAGGNTIFINELQIEIETGVGINDGQLGRLPSSAVDPLATLEISRDAGNTWVTVGSNSIGKMGEYLKRLVFRNLGRARDTVTFRLTISDAVPTYIMGAWANMIKGLK